MGRELLLSAYRVITKNRRGSITNVLALAIGIASVLFVANLLIYETSYDLNLEGVYRIEMRDESTSLDAYTSSELGPELVEEVSTISGYSRLIPFSEYRSANMRLVSRSADHAAYFKRAYYADNSVFQFFQIDLVLGDEKDFNGPGAIVISESAARTLLGPEWKTKVLNSELRQGRGSIQNVYKLVGVYADRAENTHIEFDALISIKTLKSPTVSGYTYVSGKDLSPIGIADSLFVRPTSEIHAAQNVSNEAEPVANQKLLMLLAAVAVIVLLITITNYVNSTIIHFVDRCKEVGVRKLHGASTGHLLLRLVGELLNVNVVAAVVGFSVFALGVDVVNRQDWLTYPPFSQIHWESLSLLLLVIIMLNTILSIIYPFVFINKIQIISALKGAGSLFRSKAFGQAGNVVRGLLIFQILASVVFLSASLIIYKQLQLIDAQPEEAEVHITGVFPGMTGANERFTDIAVGFLGEMIDFGTVTEYSFSNLYKGQIKSEQKIQLDDSTTAFLTVVDPDYWKGPNEIIEGEEFYGQFGHNPGQVILDSLLAHPHYGYNDSTKIWSIENGKYKTIGIANRKKGEVPRAFVSGFRYLTYFDLTLHYQGGADRMDQFLEKTEYMIGTRFPYFFLLRREQEASGKAEQEVLTLFIFFAGVSVLVAVIGLFGLSYFLTQKKSREVGIRKIHGANPVQILFGLLSDFAWLVIIAGILATPLTYFGGQLWLESYANRIDLDATIFLLPVFGIALITMLTVLDKSWKAATLNPIDILEEGK